MINEKNILRKKMKKIRDLIPEDLRNEKSSKITKNFFKLFDELFSKNCFGNKSLINVLVFLNFSSELNTTQIIESLKDRGHRVLIPRVNSQTKTMDAVVFNSYSELVVGSYGIREPRKEAEKFSPENIDLVLLPGLAFNKDMERLGYGGGFYDKFLKNSPNAYKIGLCFAEQFVDKIPSEIHDIKLDCIVDDTKITRKV